MRVPLTCLLCAAALATLATPAAAQSPFSPSLPPPAPTQPTPTAPPAPTQSSGGGLSSGAQIALFVVAGVLLGGIAWVIVRDARRSAPRPERRSRATVPPAPQPPGARGRPTGKGGARRRKR